MHTPVCNDALEYWPEGAPTDVDVSTLPAAGAITNPVRILGCGPWLGFWGPSFSGLRVGYSPTKTFPVINGLAVPYPERKDLDGSNEGFDLYLSRDTGGSGVVTIARFNTKEAAEAWAGRPTPTTGAGVLAAGMPNRSLATRATVAGGVIAHSWTQAGFLYATLHALPGNAASIILDGSFVIAPNDVLNEHVDTATGFSATGTNGDIIDIIEYGRV